MKRTKEPCLIIMILNVILLIQFSSVFLFLFLFNAEIGEFTALPIKNYFHRTFVDVNFSHTS